MVLTLRTKSAWQHLRWSQQLHMRQLGDTVVGAAKSVLIELILKWAAKLTKFLHFPNGPNIETTAPRFPNSKKEILNCYPIIQFLNEKNRMTKKMIEIFNFWIRIFTIGPFQSLFSTLRCKMSSKFPLSREAPAWVLSTKNEKSSP